MKRILALVGAVTLMSASIATPVAAHSLAHHAQKSSFKVGVVLDTGGVNDHSFNHLAYLGFQEAQTSFGVKGYYVVSSGSSDYLPNLKNFAAHHFNLVVGVGFLMANAMYQIALQYPHTHFALIDSAPANASGASVNLKNVSNLFFKEQQSGYLVGVIAGLMEKRHVGRAVHNKIGYMGGQSIPPVNRYIAGYVAGACKVDPTIQIARGYSQSFTNQSTGHDIGLAQVNSGADILFQVAGASGLGYLRAAQQKNVYGIGVDADQGYLGKYVITSALKKVDVAVKLTIRQTMTGHFRGGSHQFSLSNNATGFAPTKQVPASIVATAAKYERLIKRGAIVPPTTIAAGC
jgi:basic membrane protein A and related proteins